MNASIYALSVGFPGRDHGESELSSKKLGQFLRAKYGSVSEAKAVLGDLGEVRDAFQGMQAGLYAG